MNLCIFTSVNSHCQWSKVSSVFILRMFWRRIFVDKWHTFLYEPDAVPVTHPTVSGQNWEHWPRPWKITQWPSPLLSHSRTPGERNIASFMPAFWPQFLGITWIAKCFHGLMIISLAPRFVINSECSWCVYDRRAASLVPAPEVVQVSEAAAASS